MDTSLEPRALGLGATGGMLSPPPPGLGATGGLFSPPPPGLGAVSGGLEGFCGFAAGFGAGAGAGGVSLTEDEPIAVAARFLATGGGGGFELV